MHLNTFLYLLPSEFQLLFKPFFFSFHQAYRLGVTQKHKKTQLHV